MRFFLKNRPGLPTLVIASIVGCLPLLPAAATPGDRPTVRECIAHLRSTKESAQQRALVEVLLDSARLTSSPLIVDSVVCFLYPGEAVRAAVAGDFNGWNPTADTLTRAGGSRAFHLLKAFDPRARFEYKFVADSVWLLDPLNPLTSLGGYGPNSEVRMPSYVPPKEIEERRAIPHGRIDTLIVASRELACSHTVYVYVPQGKEAARNPLPVIFVTDGGEYLELARMHVVMDNLIADGKIPPVVGVFVDPRTNPHDNRTTRRMNEYVFNEAFLRFLADELRPLLAGRYGITLAPRQTAILGASLGGLAATYAALHRPDVFGLAASQSPAYQVRNDSIFTIVGRTPRQNTRMYMDVGTIADAARQARRMRDILKTRGYTLEYAEYPESHNWGNWRARLDDLLLFFWGTDRHALPPR